MRPASIRTTDFQDYVLNELAKAAVDRVNDTTAVFVTLQEPNVFSCAILRIGAEDHRVDAVLQTFRRVLTWPRTP